MVQVDRAILIDMDQRACLVEGGHGEGNAELDRRQRDALADDAACAVEVEDRRAPGLVIGTLFQFVDQFGDDVVGHRLVVGRDVAPVGLVAIEIALADFQRILAERIGDLLDHPFAADHALRPAEAAIGRV